MSSTKMFEMRIDFKLLTVTKSKLKLSFQHEKIRVMKKGKKEEDRAEIYYYSILFQ